MTVPQPSTNDDQGTQAKDDGNHWEKFQVKRTPGIAPEVPIREEAQEYTFDQQRSIEPPILFLLRKSDCPTRSNAH